MALCVANALADAVTLVLGDSAQDREHQLADAIAADIAAEVDHVQADAVLLEFSSVPSASAAERNARSSFAVMITSPCCSAGEHALAFGAIGERHGARDRPPR